MRAGLQSEDATEQDQVALCVLGNFSKIWPFQQMELIYCSIPRMCVYDEDAPDIASHSRSSEALYPLFSSARNMSNHPDLGRPTRSMGSHRFETLSQPTIDVLVGTEVHELLGSLDNIRATADSYFDTVHLRVPILSRKRFTDSLMRLPGQSLMTRADISALCLAMFILQQRPQTGWRSMRSSLYVTMKSIISLLEATDYRSLQFVQCRVLVAFYEMGHGLDAAASTSISACGKAARSIGLHKRDFHTAQDDDVLLLSEERKRTWWAILNLDRCVLDSEDPSVHYSRSVKDKQWSFHRKFGLLTLSRFINLCNRDALFSTEDARTNDQLPFEDSLWLQDVCFLFCSQYKLGRLN